MFEKKKCPRCQQSVEIPPWLKICFKCAYPKHERYYWKDAKVGDVVYLSGNITRGSTLIPHTYGPHTIEDVEKRIIRSGSTHPAADKTFNHLEDSLLSKKELYDC